MLAPLLLVLAVRPGASLEVLPFSVRGVSANGLVVFGFTANLKPCLWTARDRLQPLPLPKGFRGGEVTGASGNGSVLVGTADGSKAGIESCVCRWEHGRVLIICRSAANNEPAISSDGTTIVGTQYRMTDQGGTQWAFRWRKSFGLQYLQSPDKSVKIPWDSARAVSHDGSLVFGETETQPRHKVGGDVGTIGGAPPDLGQFVACRWDAKGKATMLPRPDHSLSTYVNACSEDAAVVVGDGGERGSTPAVWVNSKFVSLPGPEGDINGEAMIVSGDGNWVLGMDSQKDFGDTDVIWHDRRSRRFSEYIREIGLKNTLPGKVNGVRGISRDGRVIVGSTVSATSGWILKRIN
jgi:uncharacterized membrane protein